MNAYRMRLFRFTRTAACHNLCTCAHCQRLDAIKRKAARHELLNHTAGTYSTF